MLMFVLAGHILAVLALWEGRPGNGCLFRALHPELDGTELPQEAM